MFGPHVIDAPILSQVHVLVADPLDLGSHVLDTPALHQVHVLIADGIVFGRHVLGEPELGARRTWVGYGGVWVQPKAWARHEGEWKAVIAAWAKRDDEWHQIYSG